MKFDFFGRIGMIVSLHLLASFALLAQIRTDEMMNRGWKFARENAFGAEMPAYNDSKWEKVSLPHTWNAQDGQDGGNDYYRGVGWYRKSFSVDTKLRDKNFYLKFDGASSSAQVYVNGTLAGKHKGSFGAFCLDVTPFIKVGSTNAVAVKVTNAKDSTIAPLRGDFTIYGGLYRGVRFLVLNKLAISPLDDASPGVYVKQTNVSADEADLEVTVKLLNGNESQRAASVRAKILDHKGNTVQRSESAVTLAAFSAGDAICRLRLNKPHLWNGRQDPYLYQVVVELLDGKQVADRVAIPIGIRFYRVDPDKGFFLNDKPYSVYGVNRHQDCENMGWAITAKEHAEDFRMIEEIGANGIRLAHYQHAEEFYDLCDRGGMVVWAELALVDDLHPVSEFAAVTQQQLRELIKQNYNHPSIFFWSLQNELIPDSNPKFYGQFVQDLNALAKQLDPTRLTAVASRSKYDPDNGTNNVSDVLAYNVYRGWYEGKPEDFAAFADKLHQKYPNRAIAISEYGAGASVNQHEWPAKKPPTRGPWHPEEWQSTLHEVTWKAMAQRPFLWGTFIWNMFDFGSDGRSEGERFGQNDKGLVSFDRKIRKDAFFWYKVNWNPEPMVHITSKRFSPRPIGATEIKAYSNCESVELFLNGVSLGRKNSEDKINVWSDVMLRAGENHIVAIASVRGKQLKDHTTIIVSGAAQN